jgi:transketolase
MKRDDRIWLLTADLGYKMWDQIFTDFPDRAVNVGASEQLLIGTAVGLAEDGKIPVAYSITPFLLYRPAEWIRNFIHRENVPVKLLGGGRDTDYLEDGYTHYAGDDGEFLNLFPGIKGFWPQDVKELKEHAFQTWLHYDGPAYLNLRR